MKALLFLTLINTFAQAQVHNMNVEVHDMLITKLEKGLERTNETSIQLRLADLYSDRSRLKQIKENEQNCSQCLKSDEDRKRSVTIYTRIFDKLDTNEQKRVFEQISQSLVILNSSKEAEIFYKRILNNKYSKDLKAMAHLAQADTLFFNKHYSQAHKKFKIALALDPKLNSPLVKYRMAWCEFNSGKYESAKNQLAEILKNENNLELSLRSDIARDFSRFSSKGKINKTSIKQVHDLSPSNESKANIEFLAEELDRQSRFYESLIVNHYLLEEFKAEDFEKALAYLRIAQSEYSLKKYKSVIISFKKSTEFYKKANCKSSTEACGQYQEKSQKFVIYWNSIEKDKPSKDLLNAWQIYLSLFDDQSNMHFLAAQTFYKTKNFYQSQNFYIKTAEIIKSQQSKKTAESAENIKLFNITLQAAMGSAEESKNIQQKRQAYLAYLRLNPEGDKALEAKYQLAYLDYEEKKYKDALIGFNNIVKIYKDSNIKQNQNISIQSANLVLDILAIQKINKDIMTYTLIYAETFPKQKDAFLSIYRKALINESLDTLKDRQNNHKYQSGLIEKLKQTKTHNITAEELIKINEVRLQLAKNIKKIEEVKTSSLELINIKNLNNNIRNYALDQYIWANEVGLQFNKAYEFSLIRYPHKIRGQKELLKIGLLAELSNRNPNKYYEQALTKTRSLAEANQIRVKIVQNSQQPWNELVKYQKELAASPVLLADLTLETYTRFPNDRKAEEILKNKRVASQPASVQLKRHLEIPNFIKLELQLSKHKISTASDIKAQKNVSERVQLLNQVELFANRSIERNDFVLQVASLSLLKNEKERLAKELSELPIPKGLSSKEQHLYNSILAQRVSIIQNDSKKISMRLDQAWKNQTYVTSMKNTFSSSSNNLKKLIAKEAKFLISYAPNHAQSSLKGLFEVPKLDQKALKLARNNVQKQPFDKDKVKKLLNLEKDNNSYTHVAFLEKRLNELDKGVVQ